MLPKRLNLKNSQIPIKSDGPLGSQAKSRTEKSIGPYQEFALSEKNNDQIGMRIPRPKRDADDDNNADESLTEDTLDKDKSEEAPVVKVAISPASVQTDDWNKYVTSDQAERTAVPSERYQRNSKTEENIDDDFGADYPTNEFAIRTPPCLPDGQIETPRTEKSIGEDTKQDKRKVRKKGGKSYQKKKKQSKIKRNKLIRKPSSSDLAIRTGPKSEVWALLSKTENTIKYPSNYVHSDQALRTAPISNTEKNIEKFPNDFVQQSVLCFDFLNVQDVENTCKVVALSIIIGLYLVIFIDQIWRFFNAITSMYNVSVDDCLVANSLCDRYSMCCFNQCGNNRFQIFWSKLFG